MVSEGIENGGGVVDYVRVMQPVSLKPHSGSGDALVRIAIAAKFGTVRLLDNIEIDINRD